MTSELVLLFDTKNLTNVEQQLSDAFDAHSTAGNMTQTPSMMIVRKTVWLTLEKELIKKHPKLVDESKPVKYHRVSTKDKGLTGEHGYNAIIFRSRPVVAIDGDNIVAARVGANKE